MARRSKLTDAMRAVIVRELACYAMPDEVSKMVKEDFGIDITRQGIECYDPTKFAGRGLSKKWTTLFHAARKEFIEDFASRVPEANKAVRIRGLALASRQMKARGNYMGMSHMYEQIAKEVGNVHTNRRELTGKDGGPIKTQDVSTMTPEQIDAELASLLGFAPAAIPKPETKH